MQEYRRIISKGNAEQAEVVDLGLPSGIKWCSHNIGGTNPEDYGYYFSWGNVDGHVKESGYDFSLSTYDSTPGYSLTGNIAVGDTYDIARKVMGSPWKLPTAVLMEELCTNTDMEWVNDYNGTGVAGFKFMKKSDHSVYIFLPACSWYDGTSFGSSGWGLYWSSSYYSSSSAYYLMFYSGGYFIPNENRYQGYTGRAVCD